MTVFQIFMNADCWAGSRCFEYVEVADLTMADMLQKMRGDALIDGVQLIGHATPNRSHFLVTKRSPIILRGSAILRVDHALWSFCDAENVVVDGVQ